MKIAVCTFYLFAYMIYLKFGDSRSLGWGGFVEILQLSFIGFLSYSLSLVYTAEYNKRLFFRYITLISGTDCVYTFTCIFRKKGWVYYHTDVFAILIGITFLILIIHLALKGE